MLWGGTPSLAKHRTSHPDITRLVCLQSFVLPCNIRSSGSRQNPPLQSQWPGIPSPIPEEPYWRTPSAREEGRKRKDAKKDKTKRTVSTSKDLSISPALVSSRKSGIMPVYPLSPTGSFMEVLLDLFPSLLESPHWQHHDFRRVASTFPYPHHCPPQQYPLLSIAAVYTPSVTYSSLLCRLPDPHGQHSSASHFLFRRSLIVRTDSITAVNPHCHRP